MFFKILISFLLFVQPSEIVVDRIAAVVNTEVITLSDIDKSLLFNSPSDNSRKDDSDLYLNELKKLIDHKVVYLEYKDQFQPTDGDFENVQLTIIKRYGSLDNVNSVLKKFDMDLKDLREFLIEKIIYEKVIKDKFLLGVVIESSEIEKFYNEKYLPSQNRLKIEPKSIIEMTPQIEDHLRGNKVKEELAFWIEGLKASYKIENKLSKERNKESGDSDAPE
ncbi:MAG: hypothetical protein ABFR36_03125 [Acidobacteriota bacterium]